MTNNNTLNKFEKGKKYTYRIAIKEGYDQKIIGYKEEIVQVKGFLRKTNKIKMHNLTKNYDFNLCIIEGKNYDEFTLIED